MSWDPVRKIGSHWLNPKAKNNKNKCEKNINFIFYWYFVYKFHFHIFLFLANLFASDTSCETSSSSSELEFDSFLRLLLLFKFWVKNENTIPIQEKSKHNPIQDLLPLKVPNLNLLLPILLHPHHPQNHRLWNCHHTHHLRCFRHLF